MAVQTIVNGNVSEAEDMVANMAESHAFVAHLRQAGLGVATVLMVSCEPLDPEELPVRLRPPPNNVTFPIQGAALLLRISSSSSSLSNGLPAALT